MPGILDRPFEDTLFLRLIYLAWSVPFLLLFLWTAREALEAPILLLLPAVSGTVFLVLLYQGLKGNKAPPNRDMVSPVFWLAFYLTALMVSPLWLILSRIRNRAGSGK